MIEGEAGGISFKLRESHRYVTPANLEKVTQLPIPSILLSDGQK